MKLDSNVSFVLLFGYATGVFPLPIRQWSCGKRQKLFNRLANLYASFMLSFNAACILDINLSSVFLDPDLATGLYDAGIYYVGYFAGFWIRFYLLVSHTKISILLRRLSFIQDYTSRICVPSIIDCSSGRRWKYILGSCVILIISVALCEEILSAYFDWEYFIEDTLPMLQFVPRIDGVILFTFVFLNISRWFSLAFACFLPVFVLFHLTACYHLLVSQLDQLWRMESADAVRMSKMKEALGVISILKSCMLAVNELNFGLLFPLIVMHVASACNLPFAIVQPKDQRTLYCSLLFVSIALLVVISISGGFISREVEQQNLKQRSL